MAVVSALPPTGRGAVEACSRCIVCLVNIPIPFVCRLFVYNGRGYFAGWSVLVFERTREHLAVYTRTCTYLAGKHVEQLGNALFG